MLNRQKTLLYLLKTLGGSTSHLQLTKLSFLLRYEAPGAGGSSFYEFVPYHYGPFSFCLYQEMESLIRYNYVKEIDEKNWELTGLGEKIVDSLPLRIKDDVFFILKKHGATSLKSLIDYVYKKFPWFTIKSEKKIKRLEDCPTAPIAIYTVGYEGYPVDGFLNFLLKHGISGVIDIRRNPISRRYGFHKITLKRLCEKLDIGYFHFPELGIPSLERQNLNTTEDYDVLFNHYKERVRGSEILTIQKVSDLMKEKPYALMCVEAVPEKCHRLHLAEIISGISGIKMNHLIG